MKLIDLTHTISHGMPVFPGETEPSIIRDILPDEVGVAPVWVKENPRMDALAELLDTIGDQKVIVWSVFQPTYKAIADRCEKLGRTVAFLTGEQSIMQKQQAIEDFCRGSTNTLIANQRAGGTGINLVEAAFSIYYTRGYSLEDHLQSEGRNFRGGSEMHGKITHFHLEALDTLDEVVAAALLQKKSVAESVLAWAKTI